VLTALTTAFAYYEGHFQITYYGLLLIFAYVIYYLIAHRKENKTKDYIKVLGYGILSVVLICLLMAAIWLPVLGGLGTAARGVERGYEYATSWAMPPLELVDLVIPTFSGILDNYWGMNSFKIHLEYFGIIALIFATFTIVLYWKKRYVKFYELAALVVVLVAIGNATPFFRIPYALIPGFRLFRAPALIFYLASFSFVVLGAIGFENIFIKKLEIPAKKLYAVGGIITSVLVLAAIIFSLGGDSIAKSIQDAAYPKLASEWGPQAARAKISNLQSNYSDLVAGTWRTVIFAAIIFGLMYLATKRKIKSWIYAIVIIAIALFDQLTLVSKFLPSAPAPQQYYAADDIVRFIKNDPGVFRVFPTPWYEHATDSYLLYHDIQSAGGYVPNPLKRYQEFIGAGQSVMFNPSNLLQYPRFLDLLNAKYIIAPTLPEDISQYDPQTQRTIQQIRNHLARFRPAFRGRLYTLYENQQVMPRVHLVHEYEVHGESEVLDIMKSETYDPLHTVLLEEDPKVSHFDTREDFIPGVARLIDYRPNEITCEVQSDYPGFLVLADNWHPDWQVFVDGNRSDLYVANHTFRAVYVERGSHEILFKYISTGFRTGRALSIVTLLLALVLCVVGIRYKF